MSLFIKPCEGRVTSHYSPLRKNPVTGDWKAHKGIDYGKDGSPDIHAAAQGTVTRATVIGGYGNTVTIAHVINGQKYETLYAHLKSIKVKVGQVVKQGQLIGVKGSTGNSTGVHLHFEVHKPTYGPGQPNAIDPFPLVVDPEVKELQQTLRTLGYNLVADGIAGSTTENAVKIFQQVNGLVSDGIVGAKTLEVLNQKVKEVKTLAESKGKQTIELTDGQKRDRALLAEYGIMKADYEFTEGYEIFMTNLQAQTIRMLEKKGVIESENG